LQRIRHLALQVKKLQRVEERDIAQKIVLDSMLQGIDFVVQQRCAREIGVASWPV